MSTLLEILKRRPNPETKEVFEVEIKKEEKIEEPAVPEEEIVIPAEYRGNVNPEVAYLNDLLREQLMEEGITDEEEINMRITKKIVEEGVTLQSVLAKEKGDEPEEEVEKVVGIVDKRGDFDRGAFMRMLKQRGLTTGVTRISEPIVEKPRMPVEERKEESKAEPVEEPTEEPAEDTEERVKGKPRGTGVEVTLPTVRRRRTRRPPEGVAIVKIEDVMATDIDGVSIRERIVKPASRPIIADSYFMNNRQYFVEFINKLFKVHSDSIEKDTNTLSCDSGSSGEFSLLTHQKLVRDYLNLYTPYRGLLLYHGLGSGKTCSSIAIAEGMKSNKEVIIMTPASLRKNYVEQLKFCGDSLYKRNQFWEFIDIEGHEDYIKPLSAVLGITQDFIKKQGGAWMVNMKKKVSNYQGLGETQRIQLDKQLYRMIRNKYHFISYNGLRLASFKKNYMKGGKVNPFDNKVIVIDEAHNLISRIVNKIEKKGDSLPMVIYNLLMSAKKARIVLLSGTPIINYPNEIGILYNIIRGRINSIEMTISPEGKTGLDSKYFEKLFQRNSSEDYVEYNPTNRVLTVTKNPYEFVSLKEDGARGTIEYDGVTRSSKGKTTYKKFEGMIKKVLLDDGLKITNISRRAYKALPDKLDDFKNMFINFEDGTMKNDRLFKRRILGLTSYFRDITELMPKYDSLTDFKVVDIPMSDYQFGVYEKARQAERDQRKKQAKRALQAKKIGNQLYNDVGSTYRIFSRLFCNFVFPEDNPRPMPQEDGEVSSTEHEKLDESALDVETAENLAQVEGGEYNVDDAEELKEKNRELLDNTYEKRIRSALRELFEKKEIYLSPEGLETYGPKMLHILENLKDDSHKGLHLVYSQFRTLEGIGILQLVLEANGFARFRIKKGVDGIWNLDMEEEDKDKPKYVLYTGTESVEEKEIVRNVFNNDWANVPNSITDGLVKMLSKPGEEPTEPDNRYGDIIKVIMITASGAEGVNLRNVRYVHLMEPYWHPVRIEQVIGRARRICSHETLEDDEKTVEVFLYLMTFTEEQINLPESNNLRRFDTGKKIDRPLTSDEALYEISNLKREINGNILKSMKEASIDCVVHFKEENPDFKCFSFGEVTDKGKLAYGVDYKITETDKIEDLNVKKVEVDLKKKIIKKKDGTDVVLYQKIGTNDLYKETTASKLRAGAVLDPDYTIKVIGGKKRIVAWKK